jgi:hypothetical protein
VVATHYLMRHPAMRYTTPRRSLAVAILFLIPAVPIALDVPTSIEEYRILKSLSYCSGVDPEAGPGCLASEEVTFEGPPSHVRRSALQEWHATDDDDQLAVFDIQPGYGHYAETLPRHGFDESVAASGVAGLVTTFVLALTGAVAWVAPLIIGAAVWLYPRAQRLIRQQRGDGQHAA